MLNYKYFGQFELSFKWAVWLLFAYFCIPALVYLTVPFFIRRKSVPAKKSVSILVLGDLGHSPRMCYHALSFAKLGFSVNFCGYLETAPPHAVTEHERIDIFPIKAIHNTKGLPYLLFAAAKIAQQLFQLFELLTDLRGSQYFVVQNPPSMPLLAVLVVFMKVFSPKSRLIIDWHNLNYSILNLKYQNLAHPVVRGMKSYEHFFSRFAWLNVTVTRQMQEFLEREFSVNNDKIVTLYDRPGPQFTPLSGAEIAGLKAQHDLFSGVSDIEKYKVLATATSFTPDEDFSILLKALKIYHDAASEQTPVFVIVTGKGPLKQQFLDNVSELNFSRKVIVKSAWLSAEDYPRILAVADLAVSLHTSSSGIDLPMKIVDFFGVGVPVVTLAFPAIGELVKDGKNGLVVGDDPERPEHQKLYDSISRALGDEAVLAELKAGAVAESRKRWDENWMSVLAPVVDK